MKRMLSLLLIVFLLLGATTAYAAKPLTMDQLKKILEEPNVAKSQGLPALLIDTVGKARAEATLDALITQKQITAADVQAAAWYNVNGMFFGIDSSWWSGQDFYSVTYSSLSEAAKAIAAFYKSYSYYPSVFYYMNGGVYSCGTWNSNGYYDLSYYNGTAWVSQNATHKP